MNFGPLDPNRRPDVKTQHVYRCAKCGTEIAFISRLPAWLEKHMSITAATDCGGRLIYLREEPRMSEHKIEREAVLWAWTVLYGDEPRSEDEIDGLVRRVMTGIDANAPVVKVAIAYVESAKNHVDTVLELETNLARATEELASLRTVATYYRIADHIQRRFPSTGTGEGYRKAAEAMDKALGAGPGEASCTPDR